VKVVLGVRLLSTVGAPTSGSQYDDGDDGDENEEDHGCDDAVAEYTPVGTTALVCHRICTHRQQQRQ